jgi:hypothetical protein
MSDASRGDGRNYVIVKPLNGKTIARLFGDSGKASWSHFWPDGWCAVIEGRIVPKGERLRKSDGFSGYGWMVDNIIDHGSTESPAERKGG